MGSATKVEWCDATFNAWEGCTKVSAGCAHCYAEHAAEHGLHGGRPLNGESNGRAKLTAQQVQEIRAQKGSVGARVLASRYGVSRSAIQFIHQGKHWKATDEWPADLNVREFPAPRTAAVRGA